MTNDEIKEIIIQHIRRAEIRNCDINYDHHHPSSAWVSGNMVIHFDMLQSHPEQPEDPRSPKERLFKAI